MDKKRIHTQVIEEFPTKELLSELKSFWHPLGAIVDCGGEYNDINACLFSDLRTIFIGHNPATIPHKCLQVLQNQEETATRAARELLETGFENFAFIPHSERRAWSDLRKKAFCDALALNGKNCHVFGRNLPSASDTRRMDELRKFLKALPKPCAVFAANDKIAEAVLSATKVANLTVPDEIAVIGVDNYKPICEHTNPPLTSIEPNFRRGGILAALMLLADVMSKGRWRGARIQTFGPLRIVRRASSRLLLRPDKHVSAALDLIHREACSGLSASRVAALFPCSRRMTDIRFAKATGHTILSEIHAVQLERAKQLLKDADMPLKAISDFCGFTNPNSLRKFFLKETGMTMSRWQSLHTAKQVTPHYAAISQMRQHRRTPQQSISQGRRTTP